MIMKTITTAILLAGCVSVLANVCTNLPGKTMCSSGEVDSISDNGVVSISDTKVNGLTSVNGTFLANNSNLSAINISGTINLMRCAVYGASNIKGVLTATETKFEESIELFTGKSTFNKCVVKNKITVRKTSDSEQILYVDNSSEMYGDIIFDSGNGKVILSGNSKVHGNVIGGDVVNKV